MVAHQRCATNKRVHSTLFIRTVCTAHQYGGRERYPVCIAHQNGSTPEVCYKYKCADHTFHTDGVDSTPTW